MDSPYLDKSKIIAIHDGSNLPHWNQPGKIQFVSFRLNDSLPQNKIIELRNLIYEFKKDHPEPWDVETKKLYRNIIGKEEERLLDAGYGRCVLARNDVRKILSNTLHFNNGINYDLIAYVIMPNHVHLLIKPYTDISLQSILHSIKRYSASEINKLLNRRGSLWRREYFDRIVRNEDELKSYLSYIQLNPVNLQQNKYEVYP